MERIRVNASSSYDVIVGADILNKCGQFVSEVIKPCRVCIVTDDNVAPLYMDKVSTSLEESGYTSINYIFKNGENSKNTQTLIEILEFLAENKITRSDLIVALGGGVVGDISGFAAATYLRGIKFVQIPTTFLAAIDSSVGGKTAVNLKSGKNLCGAFHQPSLVLCDTDCLKTLSYEVYTDGVAEAVKYAVLKDKNLIELIKNDIEKAIIRCIEIKRDIVNADEFDKGERQLLNLGHTLGHSIEALSKFEITHGRGVAMGMVLASGGGEKIGFTQKGTTEEIINTLKSFGLPTDCPYTPDELAAYALNDKKRDGDYITLVIPKYFGECELKKIPIDELVDFASI